MERYRRSWRTTVGILTALSVVAGAVSFGLPVIAGFPLAMSASGALLGFCCVEDPIRRRPVIRDCAVWFGVAAELTMGLPAILGLWSMVALILLGAFCPPLVEVGVRRWHGSRPARPPQRPDRLSDRDLERRWHRTTQQLHARGVTSAMALRLVQERSTLLDELERRDPERFAALLVRSGWREPQDR